MMKKLSIAIFAGCLFSFSAFGAGGELSSYEQCNNWSRHYCKSGPHEKRVNRILLKWKKKGIPITTQRIKQLAKRLEPGHPQS